MIAKRQAAEEERMRWRAEQRRKQAEARKKEAAKRITERGDRGGVSKDGDAQPGVALLEDALAGLAWLLQHVPHEL